MDSTSSHLDATLRQARRRYELARVWRALLGFLPAVSLIVLAAALSDRPSWSLGFGAVLFVVGVAALWYGRNPRRAILPSLAAGLIPMVLVLVARHGGHACHGASCTSLCLIACVLGGASAGLFIGTRRAAREAGMGFWLVASAVAILTGAMGCARLGGSGVVGLMLGYSIGVVPNLLKRGFGR